MTLPDRRWSWRKSRHSQTENCVEVAFDGEIVGVRDSKDPGRHFELSPEAFAGLMHKIRKNGRD